MEGDTIFVKQQIRAGVPGIGQLLINVALAAAWGVLLLAGIYAWPVAIDHDLGSRVETMSGVYRAEANDAFSYAYTNGDATLRLPQLGSSQFAISIRMGGPGASVWVAFLAVATTPPTFLRQVAGSGPYATMVNNGTMRAGTMNSQTSLPAALSLTAGAGLLWVGLT